MKKSHGARSEDHDRCDKTVTFSDFKNSPRNWTLGDGASSCRRSCLHMASFMTIFVERFRRTYRPIMRLPFDTGICTTVLTHKKKYNKELSTELLPCSGFKYFLAGSNYRTHVSAPVTIFAKYLWLNLGNVFSKCLAVFFHQSIYAVSIWQIIFRSSDKCSKTNCICDNDMPLALII